MTGRFRVPLACALAILLALSALHPIFTSGDWVIPTVVGVLLVLAGGEIVRVLRWAAALGPLLSGALVLGWVTWRDGRPGAWLGFVPSRRSFAELAAAARSGFADIRNYQPPVPATHGMILLTVVGVALVALISYLMAVTLKQPPLAGLPLLGLYAVATAVAPHGIGLLAFAAGTIGYLTLLAAEGRDRLARWGRVVGARRADAPARPAIGGRIGAGALAISALLPLLLPGLHPARPGGGGGGGGNGQGLFVSTYNPLLHLREDLDSAKPVPLLRVVSEDPAPDYLQMTTLDTYTADTWLASRNVTAGPQAQVSKGLPPVEGITVPAPERSDRITVLRGPGQLDVRWLPVPFPVTQVSVSGDWRYDAGFATVFSSAVSTTSVGTYRASWLHEQPTAAMLLAAGPPQPGLDDLALPQGLPGVIARITQEVIAGKTTEFAKAVALQAYFQQPIFHYSTTPDDSDNTDALEQFLTVTHTGFCVQYAAAMAVMARLAGIPSRVAVGFTAGTRQPDGSWLVTSHDAHAWPELYFAGAGWLRFEPTPAAAGHAVAPAYTNPASGAAVGPSASPKLSPAPRPSLALPNPRFRFDLVPSPGGAGARPHRGRRPLDWLLLLAAVLLAALAAAPVAGRARIRRGRRHAAPAGQAEAAWAELTDTAADLGFGSRPSDSLRRAGARLAAAAKLDAAASLRLAALVDVVERSRYATTVDPTRLGALSVDLRETCRSLSAAVGPRRRWRARLLPPSGVALVREAFGRLAGQLARPIDAAIGSLRLRHRLRHRLRPRPRPARG
ncbi:MAG TPA: DUF3488 and transglutaminase-like domain-containing protein [Mycobacteriales bacterium]|nr:DUF3488 and transglutaminase-like domain-containing protein [Mycobacteriales bacterium]